MGYFFQIFKVILVILGENFEAHVIDPFLAETTVEEDDEGFIPYERKSRGFPHITHIFYKKQ